jgi:type IV secretion system protein TrbJ
MKSSNQKDTKIMKVVLIILVPFMVFVSHSMAQDVATEHTQILNNVELIINGERQLQSLLNEAQMIENQIEQLKSIATEPVTIMVQLDGMRAQLFDLVNQGISLSGQIANQLNDMKLEAEDIASRPHFDDRINLVVQGSDSVINATISRIGQSRQSYQIQETELQGLLAKSNAAVGQTQALQVLNQVAAQNVTQMQATQEAINNLATLQAAKMTQDNQKEEAEETMLNQEIHPIVNGTSSFDFGSS